MGGGSGRAGGARFSAAMAGVGGGDSEAERCRSVPRAQAQAQGADAGVHDGSGERRRGVARHGTVTGARSGFGLDLTLGRGLEKRAQTLVFGGTLAGSAS
jgi:hypothetical protein